MSTQVRSSMSYLAVELFTPYNDNNKLIIAYQIHFLTIRQNSLLNIEICRYCLTVIKTDIRKNLGGGWGGGVGVDL